MKTVRPNITALCSHSCLIGEAPMWWPERGRLVQKDGLTSNVMLVNIDDGSYEAFPLEEKAGCFGLTQQGELMAACGDTISAVGKDNVLKPLHAPVKLLAKIFNDGKSGPDGKFYAGTIYGDNGELGGLYMLDGAGKLHEIYEGLYLSNGMDWSPDGRTMYLVDVGVILAFDFHPDPIKPISRPRVLMNFREMGIGSPDGMCVDSEGFIWAAMWGGGVAQIDPVRQEMVKLIELPTKIVASCAFVGEQYDRLAVTTGTYPHEIPENEGDGLTYILDVGAKGLPFYRYRMDDRR